MSPVNQNGGSPAPRKLASPIWSNWQIFTFAVSLPWSICRLFVNTIRRAAIHKFQEPFGRSFLISMMRVGVTVTTVDQRIAMAASTKTVMEQYCSAHNLKDHIHTLEVPNAPAAYLHFIDSTPETPGLVLLHLPGGGYVTPIYPSAHMDFNLEATKALGASLVVLEYSLAPDTPYPGQLVQAVETLRFLLSKHSPSEIVLLGDSAGAHLLGSLLAHIKKPSPYAPALDQLRTNDRYKSLRGACFISTWVTMEVSAASFDYNQYYDTLNRKMMIDFRDFFAPKAGEVWADLLDAEEGFWKDIAGKDGLVDKILMVVGSEEVLLEDDVTFAKLLGAVEGEDSSASARLVRCTGQTHQAAIVEHFVGLPGGQMAASVLQFLQELGR